MLLEVPVGEGIPLFPRQLISGLGFLPCVVQALVGCHASMIPSNIRVPADKGFAKRIKLEWTASLLGRYARKWPRIA
jgi:hypothetical protein